jgi:hypothetical protein
VLRNGFLRNPRVKLVTDFVRLIVESIRTESSFSHLQRDQSWKLNSSRSPQWLLLVSCSLRLQRTQKTNIYDDRSRANNKKANKSCILRDEALKVVDKTKPSEDCARNSRAELLQSIIFFSLLRIDAFRGAKSRFLVSLRTGSWKIMRKKTVLIRLRPQLEVEIKSDIIHLAER